MRVAASRCQVVVIGSGFAGSILATVLARQNLHVTLLERGRHPRFAIGESATPLAALSLERLAARYDLPDLRALATHGRWLRTLPALRRGLKRGFTFYHHRAGEPYDNDEMNSARLLVAASPSDEASDTHWLREDVDAHLVAQAVSSGVDYRDQVEVESLECDESGARLRGRRAGEPWTLRADFVVDGTGPARLVSRQLGIGSALRRMRTRSALLYGHFDDLPPYAPLVQRAGVPMPAGPYPDDWAAVHHCFDGGWMYQLRFDHGPVSSGVLLTPQGLANLGVISADGPDAMWNAFLRRFPSLARQFRDARPRFPLRWQPRIQHRMARSIGTRWVALPHTFGFVDPLFSTGMAWSLLAVERLALLFESRGATAAPTADGLARYGALLERELDQIDLLVAGAYGALGDFDLLVAQAMLYFATVSWSEVRQRLTSRDEWAWSGFLGVDDPLLGPAFAASCRRIARQRRSGVARDHFDWVASLIAPRNLGGLADRARCNSYAVDLDQLMNSASLLGLERAEVMAALPRLRGAS